MNCCGVVVDVAVVFNIVKNNEVQKMCNARIPANVPRTWDSYGVGYVRGKPRLILKMSVIQFVGY